MYNTLIKILEELRQDTIVKACIEGMERIHKTAYDLKWQGKPAQARKILSDTKKSLMHEYSIYRQYVLCCLLIEQWDYGHFNTNYDTEVNNFIKNYERKINYEQQYKTIY